MQNTVLFFILLFFCSFSRISKQKELSCSSTQSDTSQYAIVPLDSNLVYYIKDAKPSTLTDNEVKIIDILIRGAIDKYNKGQTVDIYKIRPLDEYKIQLVAFINSKRERQVFVNALCTLYDKILWRKQFIHVDDGGNCFFNLKINLTTGQSYDVSVNGEA